MFSDFLQNCANGNLDEVKIYLSGLKNSYLERSLRSQQYLALNKAVINGHLKVVECLVSESPTDVPNMLKASRY